ncbi:MAG: type IV toxin-antitoxin system AbiEi family antitoxin domain-containing protein [Deltaproteobacteria bacterium]|nr:type IV toxin-antitoxin system AbiEi family antitoxin domain-containing protein [Deltaproteobacteria bacterium]
MPGEQWEKAFELAIDQYGFVTVADMRKLGEDPTILRMWLKRGKVERAGYGIYRFRQVPPTPLDPYMLATLWPEAKGVISHHSALELHGLCDINPAVIHLTIPPQYRLRRRGGEFYEVHHEHLAADQVAWHEGIRIVTALESIRQGLASGVPTHLLEQAINTCKKTGLIQAKDLKRLKAQLADKR